MAQSCKRNTKASVSISSDSDICSPEGKKARNSSRSEPNISVVSSSGGLEHDRNNRYTTGTDLRNARRSRKQVMEMENAGDIEFQRAHRIGKKKTGETRPVIVLIVRFLRFPESELVFRRVPELADDIDIKVNADFQRNRRKREKALTTS